MAYQISQELKERATVLINKYHQHLLQATITYLFTDRATKTTCGKTILGKARKRAEIDKLLGREHEDFLVIVAKDKWDQMDIEHQDHVIDHELSHCGVVVSNDGRLRWIIRQHDVAEFYSIFHRYSFRRQEFSDLIANPPKSDIIVQEAPIRRRIETAPSDEAE
jgi:hypothetical protein